MKYGVGDEKSAKDIDGIVEVAKKDAGAEKNRGRNKNYS
jgi:hypothetical protein